LNTTKTQIVSVFFVDIIGYSKQSVADQVAIKRAFNAHLGAALAPINPDGRIVLDTGDGAAVAFLQAPEDALLTSDRLMVMAYGQSEPRLYGIRSGIHFGPAVIVHDVNGFGNLVGDAINDAQRVMSFAGDHEVFASRHYAEMVARISSSFVDRFVAAGTSKDKHGRAHDVSRVLPVGYQPPTPANVGKPATVSRTPSPAQPAAKQTAVEAAGMRSSPIPIIAIVAGVVVVVAVAVWGFGLRTAVDTPLSAQGAPSAPVGTATAPAVVAPVGNSTELAPDVANSVVKEKLAKPTAPTEKPHPVESPRAPVAHAPVAKAKENFPETEFPCPQCSCPDLLTKASLGVSLNATESRHLRTQCR
jgi:class 3 adenylate cyclase